MAPSDAAARYKRMGGKRVFFPIGFDAFGLPAENAAIKRGIHPRKWTYDNVDRMRGQLKGMGAMFDWSHEAITADPEFYRWNQWFFIKMFEKGLAYRKKAPANWCPSCQTVLANEQVLPDGELRALRHRRDPERPASSGSSGYETTPTSYSTSATWNGPSRSMTMQRNWIGRSEGLEIDFGLDIPGVEEKAIRVFTTRPDTIFGVTFMVLAPEHPLVPQITTPDRKAEVEAYIEQARKQTEIERLSTEREKTGVFTGAYCKNLLSRRRRARSGSRTTRSLWYGTGAVMGVPAHDQRDFEFAQKMGLECPVVIAPPDWDGEPLERRTWSRGQW